MIDSDHGFLTLRHQFRVHSCVFTPQTPHLKTPQCAPTCTPRDHCWLPKGSSCIAQMLPSLPSVFPGCLAPAAALTPWLACVVTGASRARSCTALRTCPRLPYRSHPGFPCLLQLFLSGGSLIFVPLCCLGSALHCTPLLGLRWQLHRLRWMLSNRFGGGLTASIGACCM